MKLRALVLAACLAFPACASFNAGAAVGTLAVAQSAAVTAHAQTPPLINDKDVKIISTFTAAAIQLIQSQPVGWKDGVVKAWDVVVSQLDPATVKQFAVEIALISAVVALLR